MSATIRRRGLSGERLNRPARVLGIAAPPIAVVTVLVAGAVSPGYDPMLRTVSRLAVPGMPAAAAVDMSIGLIGLAFSAWRQAWHAARRLGVSRSQSRASPSSARLWCIWIRHQLALRLCTGSPRRSLWSV